MLRVNTKENIIRIINDVILLCKKGIEKDDATLISVLQEAQDGIIVVGECLEKETEDCAEVISEMECLCETFYVLSQNLDNRADYKSELEALLEKILTNIVNMQEVYRIAFFPYKADMWDSLESIWLACKDDPKCDCTVVPIPYYHFDAKKNEWIYRYEIDRFPDYVPVVSYEDYDLAGGVDAAFVHNPYDEYNNVTHIHSDFYSYNLKKYVNKLFYVPYYVTSGFISEEHKILSVYPNADYLVVQSESFKEGLKEFTYYDKAIVLGSPKLDRVIRLSGNKDIVPESWKRIIEGKKSLMLNTSLNKFLADGEAYLQKLAHLFDAIKENKDVVIIWRPHPLLQSTIESMRPHLLDTYLKLKDYFEKEQIGILDTTPDIINTIAIVDGYIGETASSVVNLFEAAGKPLFILNNYIYEKLSEDEVRRVFFSDILKDGEDYYLNSVTDNKIYKVNAKNWATIQSAYAHPNGAKWMQQSRRILEIEDTLYFAPVFAEEFYAFNKKTEELKKLSALNDRTRRNYRAIIRYKKKLFYLPNVSKCISEYNLDTGEWVEHKEPIKGLQKDVVERIFEDIFGYYADEKNIWMTTLYSNRVLCFDMENAAYKIYEIGDAMVRYSAVAVRNGLLYLAVANTGDIVVWNLKSGKLVTTYRMPVGYQTIANIQGSYVSHSRLLVVENKLIATPGYSNRLIQVDLNTGTVSSLVDEFWKDVFESANFYKIQACGTTTLCELLDETTLLIQKRRDASLLELNVLTGKYKIHHPKLASDEFEKLLEGEDGFEKSYTNGEFARRESMYFSFEEFLDDLVNDRLGPAMERQKKEMETMAVNLDGTCGEKVHAFMMQVLTQK